MTIIFTGFTLRKYKQDNEVRANETSRLNKAATDKEINKNEENATQERVSDMEVT